MSDKIRSNKVKTVSITKGVLREQAFMLSLNVINKDGESHPLRIDSMLIGKWCELMNVSKRVRLYFEMIKMAMEYGAGISSTKVVVQIDGETRRVLKKRCNFMTNQELNNALRQLRDNSLVFRLDDGVGYLINPLYFHIGSDEDRKDVIDTIVKQLNGRS
jgi:hypothetical protein